MKHRCGRCGREVECGDYDPRLVFHLCRPPRSRSQVRPAASFEERRHEARMEWAAGLLGAEIERSLDARAWLPADDEDDGR